MCSKYDFTIDFYIKKVYNYNLNINNSFTTALLLFKEFYKKKKVRGCGENSQNSEQALRRASMKILSMVGRAFMTYGGLSAVEAIRQGPGDPKNLITVVPDLTFTDRVRRGQYDRVEIGHDYFRVTEEQYGEWEWLLISWNRLVLAEQAIRLIRERGFEPAQAGHLLAFGESFPEKHLEQKIIALGSTAMDHLNRRLFPMLGVKGMKYRTVDRPLGFFEFLMSGADGPDEEHYFTERELTMCLDDDEFKFYGARFLGVCRRAVV
jgi:hypothetical protein